MHPLYKIHSVDVLLPYSLRVRFDDQTEQVVDLSDVLYGELYGPLRDIQLFTQVRVDPEVHTVVWPNGADFDPAVLHDWPQSRPLLIERVKTWRST
ncbi:MAG: DUF2442 domain-containing protein [Deltaproteobacteria bacterium]|nr:DUF2442 domain-containing protein [Deltaproteobacteria bacterium]